MGQVRVLLVEDDEDDYLVTRHLLASIYGERLALDWVKTYDTAVEAMARDVHDVCLLDYRLGARDGLELLRRACAAGYPAPIILMTGQGDREVDLEAMQAGAADYLVKGQIDAALLERSIRYAIQHKRSEAERMQLVREQAARRQAEEANRLKDEFLATVSHELRSPLNAMLGWARLLRGGGLTGEAATRAVETIERNAVAQNQLIEDLLDVSRIITGKLRLDVRPIELAPVVEAAIDGVRPAAAAKEIRLQVTLDPHSGPVSGDPDRLQQVIWNLLTNAIKFTPKGGRVQVRLERANSSARITVSDTGQGISPAFLPYVFDRFRQQDGALTRKHGGLGLGLAIVRQLVELHGGTVEAESAGEGQGTTFTIKLPLMIVTRAQTVYAETAVVEPGAGLPFECPPQLEGLRVLVVDDQPDARELVSAVFVKCKAEVRAAASVAEALTMLQEWRPDVLVSDIEMPGEDGYSLIRRVRALPSPQGGQTPAVALTAHTRAGDRLRALSAGFNFHVPKPVEPAELVIVVATLAKPNHHTG